MTHGRKRQSANIPSLRVDERKVTRQRRIQAKETFFQVWKVNYILREAGKLKHSRHRY